MLRRHGTTPHWVKSQPPPGGPPGLQGVATYGGTCAESVPPPCPERQYEGRSRTGSRRPDGLTSVFDALFREDRSGEPADERGAPGRRGRGTGGAGAERGA
ncbi:hypothetical protein GCM10010206_32580 [Streptomyces cinerochromogenes]|nr:hypothetical protein GCM10010206_32580 [Streptomyces cinerochromogenes]